MTALADLGAADFAAAVRRLRPRGAIWSGAVQDAFWAAVGDCIATLHKRAGDLSERESDPALAVETFARWEREYGLPDQCSAGLATVADRRAALLAKIAAGGGQSRAYFIGIAGALGYTVTIDEFPVLRAGFRAGAHCYGGAWRFTWRVNAPAVTVREFRAGSRAGERVRSWGNTALECWLGRLKPARTIIIFAYGG